MDVNMFIHEIATGSKVQLHITIGTQTLDFDTTVKDCNAHTHSIITDVIVKDGKVVNITGKGILVEVYTYPPEGLPLIFRGVKVAFYKDKSGNYSYRLSTVIQAVALNRRENYRVFIGKDVEIQCGINRSTTQAILKDLSNSGVAFTLNKADDSGFGMGQVIHTVLNDTIEELYQNYSFNIYAIIVRREELENGKIVYGCVLNSKMAGLDKYIMTKERIRLQNARGRK